MINIMFCALLCAQAPVSISADEGKTTSMLSISIDGINALPSEASADIRGTYRAGLQAGSMSVLHRHEGVFIGTLSSDGQLKLIAIGRMEASKQRKQSLITGKLVKRDDKWILTDVVVCDIEKIIEKAMK